MVIKKEQIKHAIEGNLTGCIVYYDVDGELGIINKDDGEFVEITGISERPVHDPEIEDLIKKKYGAETVKIFIQRPLPEDKKIFLIGTSYK